MLVSEYADDSTTSIVNFTYVMMPTSPADKPHHTNLHHWSHYTFEYP